MFEKGTLFHPSKAEAHSAHHSRFLYIRNGFVCLTLGLFVAAAALAVVKPGDTDTAMPLVHAVRRTLALPEPFPAPSAKFDQPFVNQTQIRAGDTLAALLQRLRVREPGLQKFLTYDKNARSIHMLMPGRSMVAAVDRDGHLAWLRYEHTPGVREGGRYVAKWLDVEPDGSGFVAQESSEEAHPQVRMAEGSIDSSLYAATDEAGIPDAITQQMTDILGSKIDFLQDLRADDRFRVVYQSYTHDGTEVGTGRILALQFINRGHPHEAVWFDGKDGSGAYYDFDGHSLKGAFLRTALQFTRISSTFGMRLHPLHRKWTSHQGVDYAAPRGTPIHSTSDGTVEFIGRQNGYGNVVIIRHDRHYSTLYAHQSRFAAGLKRGAKVRQGQLIGYVGATGWATGPHLHYEFRVDGHPVDPLSVKLPIARRLEGTQLAAFEHKVAPYRQHIRMLAELQRHDIQVASR
ncbi:M23 family metallopeptidase [Candidimonas humi]|uniref:Peptidoglycan DD-metalloendopeptidase family protein n=1 Tax=Candidimonas humi TaxID=683355 RepID=A0ABV8P089_9BURK|nr:M23 family metallopeptidase [Candidimonas humi]MBV6305423.1 M23 family metallopeptidase [Candidimonas humi]